MRTKFINVVYIINKVCYIITLLLFTTVIFGFFAEIILGGIQLISALLLFIFWDQYSKKQREKVGIYWGIVTVYFLLWMGNWEVLPFALVFIVGVGLIPMGIGWYFITLLRELKQPKEVDLIDELGYDGV
jgi:hypothetical protein